MQYEYTEALWLAGWNPTYYITWNVSYTSMEPNCKLENHDVKV